MDAAVAVGAADGPGLLHHREQHAVGEDRRVQRVSRGAGGDVAAELRLGDPSAEHHRQFGFQLHARERVLIAFRQVHGHTQCASTRDNRNLMQRIVLRHMNTDQRMARFVGQDGINVGNCLHTASDMASFHRD